MTMIRLIIGFTHDLTDPTSETLKVGVISLRENRFVSFEWTVDPAPLMTDPFTSEILRTWPEMIFLMATEGWEECKGYKWDGRGTPPPATLAEYIRQNLRHSNLHVLSTETP